MTFSTTVHKGETLYFADGYPVPKQVYDTLFPSKMFPVDTHMSRDEAEAIFGAIKVLADDGYQHPLFTDLPAIRGDKPLRSDALAVHTKQIPEVLARNAKHGINIRYDRLGRPVFTDKGQRKALMKLEKVRSMNSFDGY